MKSLNYIKFFLFCVFLLFLCIPPSKSSTGIKGNIMFDLDGAIDVPFLNLAHERISVQDSHTNLVSDTNYSYSAFPQVALYTTAADLLKVKAQIQAKNTLFTIGASTYYGLKLTFSNINTTTANYVMNYVPVFNFPITLHAKIIEKVYSQIRSKDHAQTTRTMFILNSTTVNPEKPWENVEILNAMLKEVSGSLRFMYYNNNSAEIARKIRDTQVNDIILMVNSEATKSILKAAYDRSLLKWRFRWLVYLPSTSQVNLKTIGFNEASDNITIIQFANTFNESTTANTKNALQCVLYDALRIVMRLLGKLNGYEKAKSYEGMTGNFTINYGNLYAKPPITSVVRNNWVMQAFHGLGTYSRLVGKIIGDSAGGINLYLPPPQKKKFNDSIVLKELRGNPFRIITVLDTPFVQYKANHSKYSNLNDKLEGFVIDVITALMTSLNISYQITLAPSGKYGAIQANGQWNGMILQIMNGEADLSAAAFSITNERKRVVDYLESFAGYKGAILLKENTNKGIEAMFQFLRPFDVKVWGMLLGSMVAIAIVLAILHCISPNKTNYNLYESFFFSLGSVFQGVTTTPPDKPSGRIIVCFWWFFSLIIVITYIANYGAYRTQARIQGVIASLQDLLTQNQYKYGTVRDTSYDSLLKTSTFEYMQKLNKMIRQEFKNGLVDNSDTAIKLVKQGQYAFIWDNTITRYFAYRDCLKSTAEFDQYYYGFIIPKNSDYKALLNKHLLALKEKNVINAIIAKYVYMDGTQTNPKCQYTGFLGQIRKYIPKDLFKYSSSDALTLEQTLGIFIIMISGCIISLILALIECACRICCQKCMDRKTKQKNGQGKKKGESYA